MVYDIIIVILYFISVEECKNVLISVMKIKNYSLLLLCVIFVLFNNIMYDY